MIRTAVALFLLLFSDRRPAKEVSNFTLLSVNEGLSQGMYTLTLIHDGRAKAKRLVVQRKD